MKYCWEASCSSDPIEGRGYKVTLGFFLKEEDACSVVKNRGPMGQSDGEVRRISIFENFEEYQKVKISELRSNAWHKLSPDEREAVGLTLL